MGNTHYVTWNNDDTYKIEQNWMNLCVPIFADICMRHDNLICFESEQEDAKPEITPTLIRFNGKGDAGCGETFILEIGQEMFCKTLRRPYDLAVCEILLAANAHLPSLRLESDGFFLESRDPITGDGAWDQAMENVKQYKILYEWVITEGTSIMPMLNHHAKTLAEINMPRLDIFASTLPVICNKLI